MFYTVVCDNMPYFRMPGHKYILSWLKWTRDPWLKGTGGKAAEAFGNDSSRPITMNSHLYVTTFRQAVWTKGEVWKSAWGGPPDDCSSYDKYYSYI